MRGRKYRFNPFRITAVSAVNGCSVLICLAQIIELLLVHLDAYLPITNNLARPVTVDVTSRFETRKFVIDPE